MRGGDLRHTLAAWPAKVVAALDPVLEAAAEAVAAEARRQLGRAGGADVDPDTITTGRDAQDRISVTVTTPTAVPLEFGTRRQTARPFLRPAVTALRDGLGHRAAEAVRRALARSGP